MRCFRNYWWILPLLVVVVAIALVMSAKQNSPRNEVVSVEPEVTSTVASSVERESQEPVIRIDLVDGDRIATQSGFITFSSRNQMWIVGKGPARLESTVEREPEVIFPASIPVFGGNGKFPVTRRIPMRVYDVLVAFLGDNPELIYWAARTTWCITQQDPLSQTDWDPKARGPNGGIGWWGLLPGGETIEYGSFFELGYDSQPVEALENPGLSTFFAAAFMAAMAVSGVDLMPLSWIDHEDGCRGWQEDWPPRTEPSQT